MATKVKTSVLSKKLNTSLPFLAHGSPAYKVADTLHPRLARFFARYPPPAILPASAQPPSSAEPPSKYVLANGEPNPFKCSKHPVTGNWHDPKFSLRRQADLVKLARKQGVEELLPHTVKGTLERIRRREEGGLRVKGTGVGQRVKGKESERTLKGRYVIFFLLGWVWRNMEIFSRCIRSRHKHWILGNVATGV